MCAGKRGVLTLLSSTDVLAASQTISTSAIQLSIKSHRVTRDALRSLGLGCNRIWSAGSVFQRRFTIRGKASWVISEPLEEQQFVSSHSLDCRGRQRKASINNFSSLFSHLRPPSTHKHC